MTETDFLQGRYAEHSSTRFARGFCDRSESGVRPGIRLAEHFWRDFLSGGEPRIILQFGPESAIIISTTMMSSEIEWPGIPKEFAKPFENVEYDDNLFTAAQAQEFEGEESEPLPGEDEIDEEEPQDEG
jgi:hypothetical protein